MAWGKMVKEVLKKKKLEKTSIVNFLQLRIFNVKGLFLLKLSLLIFLMSTYENYLEISHDLVLPPLKTALCW